MRRRAVDDITNRDIVISYRHRRIFPLESSEERTGFRRTAV